MEIFWWTTGRQDEVAAPSEPATHGVKVDHIVSNESKVLFHDCIVSGGDEIPSRVLHVVPVQRTCFQVWDFTVYTCVYVYFTAWIVMFEMTPLQTSSTCLYAFPMVKIKV